MYSILHPINKMNSQSRCYNVKTRGRSKTRNTNKYRTRSASAQYELKTIYMEPKYDLMNLKTGFHFGDANGTGSRPLNNVNLTENAGYENSLRDQFKNHILYEENPSTYASTKQSMLFQKYRQTKRPVHNIDFDEFEPRLKIPCIRASNSLTTLDQYGFDESMEASSAYQTKEDTLIKLFQSSPGFNISEIDVKLHNAP